MRGRSLLLLPVVLLLLAFVVIVRVIFYAPSDLRDASMATTAMDQQPTAGASALLRVVAPSPQLEPTNANDSTPSSISPPPPPAAATSSFVNSRSEEAIAATAFATAAILATAHSSPSRQWPGGDGASWHARNLPGRKVGERAASEAIRAYVAAALYDDRGKGGRGGSGAGDGGGMECEGNSNTNVADAPLCGSARQPPARQPCGAEAAHLPLEVIDARGTPMPLPDGSRLPSLGGLDGRLHALRASRDIASVTAYTEAAFGGEAHVLYMPLGGGLCRVPPRIARRVKSLAVHRSRRSLVVLTHGGGGGGGAGGAATSDGGGDRASLANDDDGGGARLAPRVRYLSHDAPQLGSLFPSPLAVCLGASVSGVALYSEPAYGGHALLLWRSAARAAGEEGASSRLGGGNVTAGDLLECVGVPPSVQSLRLVAEDQAAMVSKEGALLVLSESLGFVGEVAVAQALGGGGAQAHRLLSAGHGSGVIAAVCVGHGLRAVALYTAARWAGRSHTHTRAAGCTADNAALSTLRLPDNVAEATNAEPPGGAASANGGGTLWRLRGVGSVWLHRRSDTVELLGPPSLGERSLVLATDTSRLPALDFAVSRVAFGCLVRSIELYRGTRFEGAGLRLHPQSEAAAGASEACDAALPWTGTITLPPSWRGAVRSIVINRGCTASNLLCDGPATAEPIDGGSSGSSGGSSGDSSSAAAALGTAATEFRVASGGEILPYRTPLLSPHGFSPRLSGGARGTFQAYNPSLLVEPDGATATLVARYSNYNFCSRKRRFDDNVREAKGALMSFVVRATLNTSTWQLTRPTSLSAAPRDGAMGGPADGGDRLDVWEAVDALYPADESQTVWGAEDPRVLRLTNGETVVMVAVWERGGIQWQHMARLGAHDVGAAATAPIVATGISNSVESSEASDSGGGVGASLSATDATVAAPPRPRSLRMTVDPRFERPLAEWIHQFATPAAERLREKNWVPFEWRGHLYVEYSLEPRLVLSVNPSTAVGTPLLPVTSAPAVAAWVKRLGPVSGGTPAVELPGHGVYLALAHVKLFKKKGSRTATSSMMYKHFWYAFEARPPFAVLGASLPFTLPSQMDGAVPSIQFATGLLYRPHTHELIVSYGEMDCYATLARFPLGAVLDATLGRRKAAAPPTLLSPLRLTRAPNGSLVF